MVAIQGSKAASDAIAQTSLAPRPDWRETSLAAALIMAGMALQALLVGRGFLFNHLPESDEVLTILIVRNPSVTHALSAVAHGAESHPPTLHLLLRAYVALTGRLNCADFRALTCSAVGLALLGIYLILRRRLAPLPAAAGVLAVWAQPLVVAMAFNIRFYGPMMGAAVWLAWLLIRSRTTGGAVTRILLALDAMLLCTLHYFGVLALASICAGEWIAYPRPLGRTLRDMGPALLGPAALLACIPMILLQRHASSVPTWMSRPTPMQTLNFLLHYPAFALLAVGLATAAAARRFAARRPLAADLDAARDFGGLLGLCLVPVALAALSVTVLPATQPRYAICGAVAMAPLVAVAVRRVGAALQVAAIALLLAASFYSMGHVLRAAHRSNDRTSALVHETQLLPAGQPIVFESILDILPTCWNHPDLADRCALLDVPGEMRSREARFNTDLARLYSRFDGFPKIVELAALTKAPAFYWIENDGHVGFGLQLREATSDYADEKLSPHVERLVRR